MLGLNAQKHVTLGKEQESGNVLQTFVVEILRKLNPVMMKYFVHSIHGVRGLNAQEHVAPVKEPELGTVFQTFAVENLRRLKNVTRNIA